MKQVIWLSFEQKIKEKILEAENVIKEFLPKEEGLQKIICEAMNYSVLGGGKRLRPVMMKATYELFGGKDDVIKPFMAAMEMIHTYSLVHDDLPAMDNDEYRRGKKTTHAVFGETMGILAGDALLNYAFETAILALLTHPMNTNVPKALSILARKAGVYGMIGGQVVDVEAEKKGENISREKLDFIYRLKTGALIEASMMIGGALAGATDEELERLEHAATNLGLAFQIQDDILDVTSTFEELGKPIGSDEKNQKSTYVTFEGLEKAKADVEAFSLDAKEILASFGKKDEFLQALFAYLIHRKK